MQNPLISSNIAPNDNIHCPPGAAPPLPQMETTDRYMDGKVPNKWKLEQWWFK